MRQITSLTEHGNKPSVGTPFPFSLLYQIRPTTPLHLSPTVIILTKENSMTRALLYSLTLPKVGSISLGLGTRPRPAVSTGIHDPPNKLKYNIVQDLYTSAGAMYPRRKLANDPRYLKCLHIHKKDTGGHISEEGSLNWSRDGCGEAGARVAVAIRALARGGADSCKNISSCKYKTSIKLHK